MKLHIPKEWIERKAKEEAASGADCTAANPAMIDHVMLPDTRKTPGETSQEYLLRQRERQIHELQARMDRANTILSNAAIVKKPNYKRAVFAAIKALSY